MRCGHTHHDEELEFQIAPMVDVLLVILVFFVLITSASVLRLTSNVALPVAANAEEMKKTDTEAMINVAWDKKSAAGHVSIFHPVTGLELTFTDLDELAGAIGEVLVATATGLFVAVPGFTFYYVFRNWITGATAYAEEHINLLFRAMPYDELAGMWFDDEPVFAALPQQPDDAPAAPAAPPTA